MYPGTKSEVSVVVEPSQNVASPVIIGAENYDEAIKYLIRAYAAFPDAEVAAHLGEVLWISGDTERAMSIWQGALLKNPDHEVLTSTLERLGVELSSGLPVAPLPSNGLEAP